MFVYLKLFLLLFMCVSVWSYEHVKRNHWMLEEIVRSPGVEMRSSCELIYIGAGKGMWGLYKIIMYF